MADRDQPPDDQESTRLSDSDLTEADPGQSVPPPLKRLGDFDLIREIGRGGMGVVYEARQVSLNRRVALKVLPPALGLSNQATQRFEREAQAAAKLHHTNIVPVHAIGEHDGHHFYAMDLIEGQSLDHVLHDLVDEGSNPLMDAAVTQTTSEIRPERKTTTSQEGTSTSLSDTSAGGRQWFDTVAKLIADVADGLHYAHGRGVIHRDIKPGNLMLSREGHLCVTDFGLARMLEEPGMTITGSLLGTPAYMAPEQIAAGRINVDHRADIYSLGAVLYEMLTMQRPFPGDSREQILSAVLTKDPRPLRRFNRKIPVDLETICLKAVEKDPDRRYQSAGKLAQDLRQHLQGGVIAARRAGIARRTWKSIRRHPTAALAVVAVLIVIAASVVAWQAGGRGKEAQRLVADARLALREGTYRNGLQLIDRAVGLDPDSIDAHLVRARLLTVNRRYHEAADEARSVLQTEPQNYAAHAILAGLALFPSTQYRLVSIDPEPHLRVVEASAPESAEAYYLRALDTKNSRRRIELLDRALDLNPSDQLASVARMQALYDLKDPGLALSEADRLIATRPKSAQGWRFKAIAYRDQRDHDNARAAIERAMEIDDLDPHNYVMRSWLVGEADEKLSDRTRAIELDPADSYLYTIRAMILNRMGRFEEAIADARNSIELNADDRWAYGHLFRALLATTPVETLQSAGEPEVEVGPAAVLRAELEELGSRAEGWFDVEAKAWAYLTIGDYYRQLKDYDLAMEWVERGIEANPDAFHGFTYRRRIHKDQGDDAAAEADCNAAARIELSEPDSLSSRGQVMSGECKSQERAIEDLTRAIELAPKWHVTYVRRAIAYLRLKRYEEALADYDKASELAPLDAGIYRARALVHSDQGHLELSVRDLKRSLELDPHHAYAWTNYGSDLQQLGRLEEALIARERSLELDPRLAYAHAQIANTLAWLGRCDEATAALRRAEELAPSEPVIHANIATAHNWTLYYNCPDTVDLDEAMRSARLASEMPRFRGNLADALFRNADYAEARRIAEEIYEEEGEASVQYVGYLLAMSLWHLGEKTEARKFYDESIAWQEEHLPDDPLLKRQRQEAAELLDLQP